MPEVPQVKLETLVQHHLATLCNLLGAACNAANEEVRLELLTVAREHCEMVHGFHRKQTNKANTEFSTDA